jgi:hypothetical protein
MRFAAAAALLLAGGAIYAGLDFWFDFVPGPRAAPPLAPSRVSESVRPPSPFPVVYLGAFQAESWLATPPASSRASCAANCVTRWRVSTSSRS